MSDDEQEPWVSAHPEGSAQRVLAEHLDREGFGYWVNVDDVVREVERLGWTAPTSSSREPSDA